MGAFLSDQSGIRMIGIMRASVCLGAILIPEYLDFHSGHSSYSGISQTNAPLYVSYHELYACPTGSWPRCEFVICPADGEDTYTIAAIWRENMLGYLSADIICSEKRTVFRERSSRKTVSYEEQIMTKEKYPNL